MARSSADEQNQKLYAGARQLYSAKPEQRDLIVKENPKLTSLAAALAGVEQERAQELAQKQAEQVLEFQQHMQKKRFDDLGEAGLDPNTVYDPRQMKIEDAYNQREAMLPLVAQEAALKGKLDPSGAKVNVTNNAGLGAEAVTAIVTEKAIAERARDIAQEIERSGLNWAQLRAAKTFSGLDEQGIAQDLQNLADRILRSRTGAAAPLSEQKKLEKMAAGDFSAGPEQISRLLRNFAKGEAKFIKDKIEAGQGLRGGTLMGELDQIIGEDSGPPHGFAPTGQTYQGKPVYANALGKKWVAD